MATIGQQLLQSESGWKRVENSDSSFIYSSGFVLQTNFNGYSNGDGHTTSSVGDTVKFNFTKDKIRIICRTYSDRSTNVEINIDNAIIEKFTTSIPSDGTQILVYEKTGLSNREHYVKITNLEAKQFQFDAIDIDSIGQVKPYRNLSKLFLIQDKNNVLYSLSGGVYNNASIPVMTSNTSSNGVASASSIYNSTYDAFHAFDGTAVSSNGSWGTVYNAPSGQWLQYDFSSNKTITSYTMRMPTRTDVGAGAWAKDWIYQAYDDTLKTWIDLDKRSNIVWDSIGTPQTFNFSNCKEYKKYRIYITEVANGTKPFTYGVAIGQMQMYESISPKLDELGSTPSDSLYINNGFTDPMVINSATNITSKGIYSGSSSTLGSGQVFSVKIPSDYTSVVSENLI